MEQVAAGDLDALEPKPRAMLRHVAKLTETPWEMRQSDVETLRRVGFSEEDVLAITETAGYYAYVNRIANGLGVELEDGA